MPSRFSPTVAAFGLLAGTLALAGCSGSPTGPGSIDLTGQWAGSASDTTGFGDMVWQVSQSGGTFTGVAEITDRTVNITARGTVSGSILQGSVQFILVIPSGGFDAPFETCSTTVSGDATAGSTSLTGTYAGTSTCGGKVYSGQLALKRL
jgi:hypothetical protein